MSVPITPVSASSSSTIPGDELLKAGKVEQAIEAYLSAVSEVPSASLCLKLARCYERLRNYQETCRWAVSVVESGDEFLPWQRAVSIVQRCARESRLATRRTVKVAVLGSYTTVQFTQMLGLAARHLGIGLDLYESPFGQFQQEIIDQNSGLYACGPEVILLAVHEEELRLPEHSLTPQNDIEAEVARWTALWRMIAERSKARIVQHNFALPCEAPMGHLGARLPGSRYMMTQALNARLGEEAGSTVSLVDCERLSALFGKQRWCDPRYWHMAKQAVALDALLFLARHTVAVIGASLGLSRKCLVLDLDNTLWGGVIAEDGLTGIKLGNGVDGEAFVAFQEHILKLKNKGVILAVCSKNNYADAVQPFEKHPEMRLKLDDIALFIANWEPKPQNIRRIAEELGIGLDSLVFVDDNPVEREAVRRFVPQVDVIPLPADPSYYLRSLSQYLMFETSSFTPEDGQRTDQYRARAQCASLEKNAASIEDFYKSLQMQALVAPFDEFHLPRVAQLIGKTNQFNLTTRRHGMSQLEAFVRDSSYVHLSLRLRDRFADHGLVGLIIARHQGDKLDIDTWLMSCRVLGRTVEKTMLEHLCRRAAELGCASLQGTYIPTEKNAMAADAYAKCGFDLVSQNERHGVWRYDLRAKGMITNPFIRTIESSEVVNGAA